MDTRPPLLRSREDRIVAGVCAGVAEHLQLPVKWVRIGFAAGSLLAGAGVMLYIFLLLTVPEGGGSPEVPPLRRVFTPPNPVAGSGTTHDREARGEKETSRGGGTRPSQSRPPRFPVAEILLGGSFLIAGLSILLVQLGVQLRLQVILPGLAVLVGVAMTWWLIADRDRPERHPLPRILGALSLVAVGVIMFFITAREPTVLSVIGAALAVLAGVALAIAPWLLRINRELGAERAARAREAERAEIAAHLHDSVLQTLALIQQRSEPGTEVARLARGQERELRDWLFRAGDGARPEERNTAAAELTEHAAALEATHAVRFEVVVVGERVVGPEELIAAAREAMQNAARHAGGDVTVYLETTRELMSVEVNDRGPGFDLAQVEGSRFGVRESILGRMERAGGTAKVVGGPGGKGVSVRLEQARVDQKASVDGSGARTREGEDT